MPRLRLSELKRAYDACMLQATPHRHPDFEELQKQSGQDDPEVQADHVFIEEDNTGYDGVLMRYVCRVYGTQLVFQIDLLPNALTTETK